MTAEETTKVLATLKAAYPHSFRDMTRRDAESMIDLWTIMFADDSYEQVNAAVIAMISTRTVGYSPTVGEVKDRLHGIRETTALSEQSAWALVAKACSNGIYGYKEEFAKLPPEVRRAVGAPEQLREWAMMDAEVVQSVVASNFMRNYRTMEARAKEDAMLPPMVRDLISGISDRLRLDRGQDEERRMLNE